MDINDFADIKSRFNALKKEAFQYINMRFFTVYPFWFGTEKSKPVTENIIREAVSLAEDNSRKLLIGLIHESQSNLLLPEVFLLIEAVISSHLSNLDREIRSAKKNPVDPDILLLAHDLLKDVRIRLNNQLKDYRSILIQHNSKSIQSDAEQNNSKPAQSNAGRKPKYDWHKASNEIWGQILRGDFKPKKQAEIEKKLIQFLTKGDEEPSESVVRPYARNIWEEYQKD